MHRLIEKVLDRFLLSVDNFVYNGYMEGGVREVITFIVILLFLILLGAGLIAGIMLIFRL